MLSIQQVAGLETQFASAAADLGSSKLEFGPPESAPGGATG